MEEVLNLERKRKEEEEEIRNKIQKEEEEFKRKLEEKLRRQQEDEQEQKRQEEEKKEQERKKQEEERREQERKRLEEKKEQERKRQEEERREQERKRQEEEKKEQERKKQEEEKKEQEQIKEIQKKKDEKIENRKLNDNSATSSNRIEWVEYKVRNGRTIVLDCSLNALARFRMKTYHRVNTPAGTGTVIGVDQEHGFLWFQLDKDMKEGLSYWDDITDYDTMICKGITLTDEMPVKHFIPLPKSSEDLVASIHNHDEKDMMRRAIQESLLRT